MQEEIIEDLDANDFSDEESGIAERLFEVMQQNQRKKSLALKEVNKNALNKEVDKMNQLPAKVRSENISVTNDLIYAAAVVTTERLGVKINKKKYKGKLRWKKRLEGQVKQLRKDLSRVEELRRGTTIKAKFEEELQRRYWIKEKDLIAVSEEMKQRITAKAAKITRFQARIDQFRQKRLFRENQSRFYDHLNGKERVDIGHDKEGSIEFWSDIWSEEAKHNNDAEWLKNLREEVRIEKQGDVVVTREKTQTIVNKMSNWKALGPDLV